jgi:hypothetical protein
MEGKILLSHIRIGWSELNNDKHEILSEVILRRARARSKRSEVINRKVTDDAEGKDDEAKDS